MSNIRKIIDRVQKLLAASKSENEHEAALAASRAAKLMEEYNLSEALIRVHDSTIKPEPIVDGVKLVNATKKRSAWRESIADAVAHSLGCRTYLVGGRNTVCFGREGATQAWNYTCQYLFREVDRLADEAWDRESAEALAVGQTIKRWKNAFRVGAAYAVAARLYEQTNASKSDRKAQVDAVLRTQSSLLDDDGQALMVVDRDEHEFANAYAARSAGFVSLRSVGQVSSRTGYNAGKEAGQRVHLGGGRGGLPAGQGSLK
jgi:hypothetical protein